MFHISIWTFCVNLRFPNLRLPTQRKIASILSAYDDLIENNTRRIAILEAMAQAIYREWFVEFRFPGHEKVKLVDSPLGKIPEGWNGKELTEHGVRRQRQVVPRDRRNEPIRYGGRILPRKLDVKKLVICGTANDDEDGQSLGIVRTGYLFGKITPCCEQWRRLRSLQTASFPDSVVGLRPD